MFLNIFIVHTVPTTLAGMAQRKCLNEHNMFTNEDWGVKILRI